MRALVLDRIRGPLAVREVPDPVPPDDGVVVRVLATGLCRSDWHAWAGHDEIRLPHVPGHELAGVVVATGAGVSRWLAGDRVTVPFVEGCGRCAWCPSGNAQVCPDQQQPGFTHWGSFAEYVGLHAADTSLVAIPVDVTAEAAASLGCRFATAYRALTGRARLAAGEWVTVIGAGGVGLSSVMIAKALGARVVAAGWGDLEQASATFSAPEDQRVRESIQRARALDPRQAIRTTAREMAVLLRLIWRDEAGPAEACAQVRRMMARQVTRQRLALGFPRAGVQVAAKSGSLLGVIRNEAGVITMPGADRYAVAVFTRADRPYHNEHEINAAIGTAAARAIEYLRRWQRSSA